MDSLHFGGCHSDDGVLLDRQYDQPQPQMVSRSEPAKFHHLYHDRGLRHYYQRTGQCPHPQIMDIQSTDARRSRLKGGLNVVSSMGGYPSGSHLIGKASSLGNEKIKDTVTYQT